MYQPATSVPALLTGLCDFALDIPADRAPRILQITDMQIIDASQRRRLDRLNEREIACWQPEYIDVQCLNHIRSLVAQAQPDLIVITGDVVYGEFDDSGRVLELFCRFMDSLCIPWTLIFGNHDNESARGVAWQCERYMASEYCIFTPGHMTGNSNFTIALTQNGMPVRILYMIDSNGCANTSDTAVTRYPGVYPDQMAWLTLTSEGIAAACGQIVPGFACFHHPCREFIEGMLEKGYLVNNNYEFTIGVGHPAADGDFGCCHQSFVTMGEPADLAASFTHMGINGVFVGHKHSINTSVLYKNIRWTFGLKTGQYDHHTTGQIGGTLITLDPTTPEGFTVHHIPSLVPYAPFPNGQTVYE